MNEKGIKEKIVRMIWGKSDDTPPIYANQLYITHSGEDEFHLVFGYFMPPLTIGLEEEELPNSVEIKQVAKIVVSPEFMKKVVDAVNKNYSKYIEAKNKSDE